MQFKSRYDSTGHYTTKQNITEQSKFFNIPIKVTIAQQNSKI